MEFYNNNNKIKNLRIKIKGIENITNMDSMFYECTSLSNLLDISKWNTNNVTSMHSMFSGCSSLSNLSDISKWNTYTISNGIRESFMNFFRAIMLLICVLCFLDVYHYQNYQIYLNGILVMLLICILCFIDAYHY